MKFMRLLPCIALTGAVLMAGEGAPESRGPQNAFLLRSGPQTLTLDDAVRIALRQNAAVLNAEQEIQRTRGQVIEVRAQALPQITINGSFQQQDRSLVQGGGSQSGLQNSSASSTPSSTPAPVAMAAMSPTPTPTPTPTPAPTATPTPTPSTSGSSGSNFVQTASWSVTFQARQLLYSGGQVGAGIRIAHLVEDQSIWRLRDTVDTIISTVRQQFYTVLVNKALIAVQQEQVTLLESQLQDQRNRFEAGTVPRFNVLQAEVALANAQPPLIQARNNYHIAQLQLSKTLGYETRDLPAGREPFTLIGELTIPPIYTDLTQGLRYARERRPFLKAQRQNILIDVENITVAAAGYKPTISAGGGFTVENNRLSHDLTDTVSGWFFGLQGSWAIFDGFETYGKLKQAKARLEEARVTYEDSVQQVDLEVQQSWANLQQARETIAGQQKTVEQAQEAVRLARERLAAGAGTQLDVLNSTVALAQAHTTELQARLSYNTALAEFERVTAVVTKYNDSFRDPLTHPRPERSRKSKAITKAAK